MAGSRILQIRLHGYTPQSTIILTMVTPHKKEADAGNAKLQPQWPVNMTVPKVKKKNP